MRNLIKDDTGNLIRALQDGKDLRTLIGEIVGTSGSSGPTIIKGTSTIETDVDGNLTLNFGTTLPNNTYQVFITVITNDSGSYTFNVFQKTTADFKVFFSANGFLWAEQFVTFDWMIVQ